MLADCGSLPNPTNGSVILTGTVEGSFANYTCNDGFELEGASDRVCQGNGNWSGSEPFCRGMFMY